MAEEIQILSRHDLEAKIVKRCWENEEFRQEFTADPAGAFVKYLDYDRRNLPKIVVHEETPGSWHIVVPAKPSIMAELSDEDLERVAGGVTPVPLAAVAAAVGGAAAAAGKVAAVGVSVAAAGAGSGAAAGSWATPIGITVTVAVGAIVTIGVAVNEGNKKKKKSHW